MTESEERERESSGAVRRKGKKGLVLRSYKPLSDINIWPKIIRPTPV